MLADVNVNSNFRDSRVVKKDLHRERRVYNGHLMRCSIFEILFEAFVDLTDLSIGAACVGIQGIAQALWLPVTDSNLASRILWKGVVCCVWSAITTSYFKCSVIVNCTDFDSK
jgi:hypothetical protein